MFQTKFVENIKTHISFFFTHFMFSNFFWGGKSCLLGENVENYGGAREATDENTIRGMLFACWVSRATREHVHAYAPAHTHNACTHKRAYTCTHTHTEKYVILIAFPRQ